jgi:voltage-gated potassium channel
VPLSPRIDAIVVRSRAIGGLRWRLFREWALLRALYRRLFVRVILLISVIALGGAAFYGFDDHSQYSYLDAVYAAFGLIFGDHPAQLPTSWALRILHFLLPIVGLGVVLEGIVEITAVVRDRRNNERAFSIVMAEMLKDHVILVGLGRVGYRIYRTLHRLGLPVVIIEADEKNEFITEARRDGSPLFIGDARRESLLVDAGLERARAVVIATNDDLVNLEIALDARQKRPNVRVVMRMFDQNMADKVHAGFGIRAVLSTAGLAATTFAAAAIVENVLSTSVLSNQLLVTLKTPITETDAWCGRNISEVTTKHRLVVLGLTRNHQPMELFPPPDTTLCDGDELVVQGLYDELFALSLAKP